MNNQIRECFDAVASVLLRCWLLGFGVLLFGFFAIELFRKPIYEMHVAMFGLSHHEMDLIIYGALGVIKIGVIMLFLIPWVSIKLVLRKSDG